jgi:predicted kinase
VLYSFAGFSGTGKSTLARSLAAERRCVYLRIDTIEQALRDAGHPLGGPEGYLAAYAIAADNLNLGRDVLRGPSPRTTMSTLNPIDLRLRYGDG